MKIKVKIMTGEIQNHSFEIIAKSDELTSLKDFSATEDFLWHMLAHNFLVPRHPHHWGVMLEFCYPEECELNHENDLLLVPVKYAEGISNKILDLMAE